MGIQAKTVKPRKCNVCQCMVDTTADGIKAHEAKCVIVTPVI